MFFGEHFHVLDAKGRLQLPSKFRRKIDQEADRQADSEARGGGERAKVFVTKGEDFCLQLYPLEAWEAKQNEVLMRDTGSREAREYRRAFFSGADELEFDGQGRILLRDQLREYAGIVKDCAVVGNGEFIEIWSQSAWERYRGRGDEAIGTRDESVATS